VLFVVAQRPETDLREEADKERVGASFAVLAYHFWRRRCNTLG